MKIEIYKKFDTDLQEKWLNLWKSVSYANYTNSPQWFLSVIESFGYKDFVIIAIYQEEELVAIGGLVKVKKFGLPCYTVAPGDFVLGIPFIIDPSDSGVRKNFFASLRNLGTVYLENIPEMFLASVKNKAGISTMCSTVNLYFPIHIENNMVTIPKRSRLLNRIRGIEDDFTMKYFTGENAEKLDLIYSIDKESSKQNKGYNVFNNKKIKEFYKNLAKNFREDFYIHILFFKEKPIAYYIGFLVNNTYYWSQNAFISEYSNYSPGKILLVKIIDFFGLKNVKEINFGSGDYRIKRLFTDEYVNLYNVVISNSSLNENYIKNFTKIKNFAYHSLQKNAKLYSLYRKVKTN